MAKKQSEKRTTSKKSNAPKAKAPGPSAVTKKPAETKAAQPEAQETASKAAPVAPAAPRTPDPRLPAPGTLLQKLDRHGAVRCECTVEADGIRYAGKLYKSLSAAAMAAAKELGLTNRTQNGFVFWGLSKPPRAARDPLAAVNRAWERYHGNVEALVKDGVTDENRTQVVAAIRKHAELIETLREKVA